MQRPARRGHREDGRRLRGELGKSKGGELCVVSGGGRRELLEIQLKMEVFEYAVR
jgi:hypothetical protein